MLCRFHLPTTNAVLFLSPPKPVTLASVYAARGRATQAERLYGDALTVLAAAFDASHPALCEFLDQQAALVQQSGDMNRARELHRRSLDIKEKTFGPSHEACCDSLYALAQLSMEAEQPQQALQYITRVRDIANATFGPSHPLAQDASDKVDMLHELLGSQ